MQQHAVVEGVESEEAERSLYSTIHGAGRVMSRSRAAGRKRWIKDAGGRRTVGPGGAGLLCAAAGAASIIS